MLNSTPENTLEHARARIAAQVADAEARANAATSLSEDLTRVTATASSRRGEVKVSARPNGTITSVVFSAAAMTLSPGALSTLATSTITSAQHKAAIAAVQTAANSLGESSPFVAQLRNDAETTFPAPSSSAIEYR